MASIFSHPAVPVGLALALGTKRIPRPLLIAGIISSIAPDIDCLGFAFGVPYESQWGHRGFTHSIVFALVIAALWAWRSEEFKVKRWLVFGYTFVSALSHPLIDAMTDGGEGIAFFWPFSTARYFFPFNPIPVSPIGNSFFSARGLHVFGAELLTLWLPCLIVGGIVGLARREMDKDRTV